MTVNMTGWYGDSTGTITGPGDSPSTAIVTKIEAYSDENYIYCLILTYSGVSGTVQFGTIPSGGSPSSFTYSGGWVKEIRYHTDATTLRGLDFKSTLATSFEIGLFQGTDTAFNGASDKFTDIKTSVASISGVNTIVGILFYYTTPTHHMTRIGDLVDEFALAAAGIMAHSLVVVKSFKEVGKLRHQLNVKAPSCDPPAGTDPLKVQLWYRTFRAQENSKEAFLIFAPSVLIAAVFGYRAFGKWAPNAVGALALVGAYFRYKYLTAYIEDADKRGAPFGHNVMFSVRPVAWLAVASCGYLVGRRLYQTLNTKKARKQSA